ncbi:MAG: alpha/beta fold hydrolase [Desulfobacterales bacterium]
MEEQIHFRNHSGEKLAATLHLPKSPTGNGIVLGHCFTCSRHTGILRQIAGELSREGFVALRFDFSGNGQSEGSFDKSTYSKQISEMQAAMDIVAARGATWIGMAGHSMGGLVAFLTAAQTEAVKAVCALASRLTGIRAVDFFSRDQRAALQRTGEVFFSSRGRSLKLTENFFADADRFDPPNLLKTFDKPLMVVHGDMDEIIAVEEAYKVRDLSGGRVDLEIVPEADHMFSREEDRIDISRSVAGWFKEQSDI